MAFYEHPVNALNGKPADLARLQGQGALVVNVASKCGLTPQYEGLQKLQRHLRRPRLHGARLPVQPVPRAGAGHGRRDPGVLLGQLRRDVPAVREDRRQRRRQGPRSTPSSRRPPTSPTATPATSAGTSRSSSCQPDGRGRRPVQPDRRAPGPGARERHRGPAPRLASDSVRLRAPGSRSSGVGQSPRESRVGRSGIAPGVES